MPLHFTKKVTDQKTEGGQAEGNPPPNDDDQDEQQDDQQDDQEDEQEDEQDQNDQQDQQNDGHQTQPPEAEVRSPTKIVVIGTHDGRFHTDEVIATRLLVFICEQKGQQTEIVRSRDPKILEACQIVVDVGKVYQHDIQRYDHHQESCQETFTPTSKILLSSAGLIWRHYGCEFIELYLRKYLPEIKQKIIEKIEVDNTDRLFKTDPKLDTIVEYQDLFGEKPHSTEDGLQYFNVIEEIWKAFYYRVLQEVDGHDNGIPSIKHEYFHNEMYNYFQYLGLGNTVGNCNGTDVSNHPEQMQNFKKAQAIAWEVIQIHLNEIILSKWQFFSEQKQFEEDFKNRKYPYLLVMRENYTTWREQLKKLDLKKQIKFTVHPRNAGKTEWGFNTNQSARFVNDIDLLSEQRIKDQIRNKNFPEMTESDLIFVHKNLFCGASKSRESAVQICVKSYERNQRKYRIILPSIVGTIAVVIGMIYMINAHHQR